MKTSEQINEIAKAMSEAQNKIKPAMKDGVNPHFKSKYTSIAAVWESLREPITSNGLTVWQDVQTHERGVSVETRIVHSSGQWVEFGPLTMPVSKADAQGFGSCISYAKRYALCAAIGIVSSDDDDDANASIVPESARPLSEKQVNYLSDLVVKVDDPEYVEKLCKHLQIKHIMDVGQKDFERTIGALTKKIEGNK